MKTSFRDYLAAEADPGYSEFVNQTWESYRLDWEKSRLSNNFEAYATLIQALRGMDHIEVRSLFRYREPAQQGRIVVGLRHDVDIDHKTALRCARILARHGLPGTFFFLHTAYYYGQFENGVFLRNPGFVDTLRAMAVTGCEIGLHADPLGVFIPHGIDGNQAIVAELDWLRRQGIAVRGLTVHHANQIYGTVNFEIFQGLVQANRPYVDTPMGRILLQTLILPELGLDYEGNFFHPKDGTSDQGLDGLNDSPIGGASNNRAMMRTYLHDNPHYERECDLLFWVYGRNRVAVSDRVRDEFLWEVPLAEVPVLIQELSPEKYTRVLFVLHPCYFNQILPIHEEDAGTQLRNLETLVDKLSINSFTAVEGLEKRIIALHASIRTLGEATRALDAKTIDMEARSVSLEAEAQALDARTKELDARTKELDARTKELDARTKELDARSAVTDGRADELETRAHELGQMSNYLLKEVQGLLDAFFIPRKISGLLNNIPFIRRMRGIKD